MNTPIPVILLGSFLLFGGLHACRSTDKAVQRQKPVTVRMVNTDTLNIYGETEVDKQPKPKGGYKAFSKYMDYPVEARKKGIEGQVFVRVLVLKSGKGVNYSIEKSVHPILDREALRITSKMDYIPATKNGRPVHAYLTFPIGFFIDRNNEPSSI